MPHKVKNLINKKNIVLTKSKGKVVKVCPGREPKYCCCDLRVINIIDGCPINCSYCFLNFYKNSSPIFIYTDFDKIFFEIEEIANSNPARMFRFTTGEMGDAFATEGVFETAPELIKFFKKIPNSFLELKTKTDNISHILSIPHSERVIISWSVNPQKIIKTEERGSASIEKRLISAKKAMDNGYLIAFHFDPLIYFPYWEKEYIELIEMIFSTIKPERIIYISIGTLRFAPNMKKNSKIFYEEFTPAMDGKMRYLKPVRYNLYRLILSEIRKFSKEVFCYLCMETEKTWERIFSFIPSTPSKLEYLFAKSIYERFGKIIPFPEIEKYH